MPPEGSTALPCSNYSQSIGNKHEVSYGDGSDLLRQNASWHLFVFGMDIVIAALHFGVFNLIEHSAQQESPATHSSSLLGFLI